MWLIDFIKKASKNIFVRIIIGLLVLFGVHERGVHIGNREAHENRTTNIPINSDNQRYSNFNINAENVFITQDEEINLEGTAEERATGSVVKWQSRGKLKVNYLITSEGDYIVTEKGERIVVE